MLNLGLKKLMICFGMISLFLVHVSYCHANSSSATQHSKDYRSFPKNTPEAVLTAFVEADLGDFYNRQNDDRYHLWWGLTERGGAPEDDGVKLFIQSYKITEKAVDKMSRDVIVNLELEVRAFWSSDNPEISGASRRDISVIVTGSKYSLREKKFLDSLFDKDDDAALIHRDDSDYYYVPKNKRQWIFPVRMTQVKGKWVIASENVPPEVFYGNNLLSLYKNEINKKRSINDVCTGKRRFERKMMESYQYLKSPGRSDESRFKSMLCGETDIKIREEIVGKFIEKMKVLERLFSE